MDLLQHLVPNRTGDSAAQSRSGNAGAFVARRPSSGQAWTGLTRSRGYQIDYEQANGDSENRRSQEGDAEQNESRRGGKAGGP